MVRADCSLMNSKPPPIKLGCNTVDARHDNMGGIPACANIHGIVAIAQFFQSIIAAPPIAANIRALFYAV